MKLKLSSLPLEIQILSRTQELGYTYTHRPSPNSKLDYGLASFKAQKETYTLKILWKLQREGYLKKKRVPLHGAKTYTRYQVTDQGRELLKEFGL